MTKEALKQILTSNETPEVLSKRIGYCKQTINRWRKKDLNARSKMNSSFNKIIYSLFNHTVLFQIGAGRQFILTIQEKIELLEYLITQYLDFYSFLKNCHSTKALATQARSWIFTRKENLNDNAVSLKYFYSLKKFFLSLEQPSTELSDNLLASSNILSNSSKEDEFGGFGPSNQNKDYQDNQILNNSFVEQKYDDSDYLNSSQHLQYPSSPLLFNGYSNEYRYGSIQHDDSSFPQNQSNFGKQLFDNP